MLRVVVVAEFPRSGQAEPYNYTLKVKGQYLIISYSRGTPPRIVWRSSKFIAYFLTSPISRNRFSPYLSPSISLSPPSLSLSPSISLSPLLSLQEMELPFIKLAATEVVSGVSGASEHTIRDLFQLAKVRDSHVSSMV